jgi:hypothetical protein
MQRARRTRRHPPAAKAPEIRGNAAADRGDGRCGVGRRSDLSRARNRGRGRPRRAPPSPHREATAGPGRRFVPKYKQIAAEADRRRKAGEGFDRLAREMKVSRGTFLRAYDFANRDEAAAAEAPAPVSRGVRSESQAQVRRHGARHRECRQAARCCDRWACGRRTCGGPQDTTGDCCGLRDKPRSHDTSRRQRPNSWLGWARSFRSSARGAAAISG